MNTNHIIYCDLKFSHEYWNQSNPELFDISYTEETQETFRSLGIITKLGQNQLTLLLPEHNLDHQLLKQTSFQIILIQRDRSIKNYSNVPQFDDSKVLYYRVDASQLTASKPDLLPIRRSLYEESIKNQLADSHESKITDLIVTPENDPAYARNVNALADGIYSASDNSFYYQKKLIKDQFAIIQLYCKDISAPTHFTMKLDSRDLYLSYRIRSKNHSITELKVVDINNQVTFNQSDSDETEIIFTTEQPVKIMEKTPYQFSLFNGSKKPVKEKLPLGQTHNLKTVSQQPDRLLNEIFIHV